MNRQGGGSAGLVADATAIVRDAAGRDPWLSGLVLDAIGWATVELERAAEELGQAFTRAGLPGPAWAPGPRDSLLGASSWVSSEWWPAPSGGPGPAIVLLEPDTEGRLAATLARFGEGVGAIYLSAPAPDAAGMPHATRDAARHAGAPDALPIDRSRLGAPAAGPAGTGRLLLARPTWGPHVVVLDRR
ncbi:MAG TPA: hypothetical protein VM451_11335 [Candidatus Limnocylindria bacterium]|nr:hypothetical protein [Candidatus Limnocylindria bacterium]